MESFHDIMITFVCTMYFVFHIKNVVPGIFTFPLECGALSETKVMKCDLSYRTRSDPSQVLKHALRIALLHYAALIDLCRLGQRLELQMYTQHPFTVLSPAVLLKRQPAQFFFKYVICWR